MNYTRREMLIGLAGLGGTALIVPKIAEGDLPGPDREGPFSPEQRGTLAAAVDRLLPGAVAAGVPEYLDYWLVQKPFQPIRNYFAYGAGHLKGTAGRRYGKSFAGCTGEEQDVILAAFAAGEHNVGKFRGDLFFRQLMEMTLEGYLSDPRYGGNRNRSGWEFIGLPDGLRSCWWNPDGVKMVLDPDEGFQD